MENNQEGIVEIGRQWKLMVRVQKFVGWTWNSTHGIT